MRLLLIFFSLIILTGCKKGKEETIIPLKATFVIDSIVYMDYGADMYYKLIIEDGKPPYDLKWATPSENIGTGPFHKKLTDSYNFKVEISDSKNLKDTVLEYNYDYRDKLVGEYSCIYHRVWWGPICELNPPEWQNLTLQIFKAEDNNIALLDEMFKPDSTWNFHKAYDARHILSFYFNPQNDSISVYQGGGGPACMWDITYKGKKIKK